VSSGKSHDKINGHVLYVAIIGLCVLLTYLTAGIDNSILLVLAMSGFYWGTYCFGPDLDTRSLPYYRWKKLRFVWKPYQKMFSHRSIWTHGWVVGDLIRIGYILIVFFPLYAVMVVVLNVNVQQTNQAIWTHILTYRLFYVSFVSGIVLASSVHIVTDHLYSARKKRRKKKQQKKKRK